jgi:hypothetical protein
MKYANSTNGNTFPDEMEVDLHMFGALMLYRVGGEVDGADIVAVDEAGFVKRVMEFLEKLPQPRSLSDAVSDSPVLGLSARARNSGLPLRGPGDKAATEEYGITGGGAASVRASGPISISVDDKLCWGSPRNDEAMIKSPLEISQDPFGSNKMNLPRIVHVKANLLDGICNVGPGECQVLKSTHEAAVIGGISNRGTISCRYFGAGVNRSGAWFAISHAMASQNVQRILTLREEQRITSSLNCHAKKMVKRAEILHGKLLHQSINNSAEKLLGRCSENNIVHVEQQIDCL